MLGRRSGSRSTALRRGAQHGGCTSVSRAQARLRAAITRLRREARKEGLSEDQIGALLSLARRAQRASLMAAHFEELRALLVSWRYLHRWVALLMFLLVAGHIVTALRYARIG